MIRKKMKGEAVRGLATTTALVVVALTSGQAFAQAGVSGSEMSAQDEASPAAAIGDIVVTARKRDETTLRAPVILDVVTPQKIEQLHITDAYALNSVVPSLTVVTGGSFVGVTVAIRGLGNGASANLADQTVALNIDGLTAPSGQFYRAGTFDLGQIEVLKGPQSLFFGKSTSGGVLVLHTADPTKEWDSKVSGSYETVADEAEVSGFISGPITDRLGFRIAGVHSRSQGFLVERNPAARDRRKQSVENDGVRATLAYDGDDVRAKVKAFYARNRIDGDLPNLSNSICPDSTSPFLVANGFDDCRLNRTTIGFPALLPYRPGNYGPTDFADFAAGSPDPIFGDGQPYGVTKVVGVPLQVDVDLTPELTFTSLSGYQQSRYSSVFTYGVDTLFGFALKEKNREYSQEVRLTSDFKDSWINFMIGGIYADGKRDSNFAFVIPAGAYFSNNFSTFRSKTSSAFAQVQLTPIDPVELSVGARYTSVHRYFNRLLNTANFLPAPIDGMPNVSEGNRDRKEDNFSPEITLSYRPRDNLTLFASYKEGYKAHSFNAVISLPLFNDSTVFPYDGETAAGFEGGIKGRLLDNHLSFTLTGYRYNYDNLQVSFTDVDTSSVVVVNGADARIQGIEATVDYAPPALPGVTLSAAVNYNDAYYRSFPASPCYASQTPATGCMTLPTGERVQDQAGERLPFAAKFNGNVGVDYATSIGDGYTAGVNVRAAFTSGFQTSPERSPLGYQKGYTLLDAGLRFGPENEAWGVSLLCRNCTNEYYRADSVDSGIVTVPGSPSPVFARLGRPRQFLMQLTVRPGRF